MNKLISLLLLLPFTVLGQQEIIGRITDQYRKTIDYANILNIQTGEHIHSDSKGQFVLGNNTVGDTIEISHILYETIYLVLDAGSFKEEILVRLDEKQFDLSEVVIKNEVQNLNVIADISLETNPINSSQELLRKVPGLVIGQHAGGGKAEQIFLRGFDIDHGTDIRIGVDGIPVNMVSHAHGQGYSDLHFLIPETVEKMDFGKGPYYTQQGNFATAGYVNFETKEKLDNSVVGVEYGRFNTLRIKGLFNLLKKVPNHNAYIAGEYRLSDGAFESSQHFNRVNIFGKYTGNISPEDKLSIQASYFYSKWDASGQIPQRAVDAGLISRFGAIDDTEGGQTSRGNVLVKHTKFISDHSSIKSSIFYSNYNFELYSNFTFFLEDSINGDQIKQLENRNLFGAQTEWSHLWDWDAAELLVKTGVGFRYDDSDNNELSRTKGRKETLEYLKLGNIDETNVSAWVEGNLKLNKFTINLGTRLEYFKFNYVDLLDSAYSLQAHQQVIATPKLNLLYNPTDQLHFYLKTGIGFHSNDTRVSVARTTEKILPLAYGADLGTIWKPIPRLIIDAAGWVLYSEQEMVYVGDAAIVEPSGQSIRAGFDLGINYQLWNWLYLDASVNYAYARSLEASEGENYIPLAPDWTSTGGVSIKHPIGLSGGIRYRFINNRPANEDYSLIAKGYTVVDMNVRYQYKKVAFGISIENLFNSEWNETQFATESRMLGEANPVEEIHFTPGTPFFIKGSLEYLF